jgi:ubiquinone/menaquinone biosynthesis C-methylase UbiE
MNLETALTAMAPAVQEVQAALGIPPEGRLKDLVEDHIDQDKVELDPDVAGVSPVALARLYELRARHLDWTYETGYLGFFARNAGTRYTFRRRLEEQFELLSADPEGSLLEVGCGAGILPILAAQRFSNVIGLDVSPTAIEFARRLADRVGARNVRFYVADAEKLPFPNGAFSAVVCGEVIGHVASPEKAILELGRVTAPGGTLVLSTPCALSPTRAAMRLAALVRPAIQFHREKQVDRRLTRVLRGARKEVCTRSLVRVKKRFRYGEVVRMMRSAGMQLREARGAALDLLPAPLIYPMLPERGLGALRATERVLNRAGLLPRVFSISTVFRFEKIGGNASSQ